MSRASLLLSALTAEPTTTSDLYDRIGYATLTRVGLIPYESFRAELAALAALGKAARSTVEQHFTWRRCGQATVDAYRVALENAAARSSLSPGTTPVKN